jgi:hypothetical protein
MSFRPSGEISLGRTRFLDTLGMITERKNIWKITIRTENQEQRIKAAGHEEMASGQVLSRGAQTHGAGRHKKVLRASRRPVKSGQR